MKIVKKDLKFDMVLDGEKINTIEELREHPSTELLDLQKDGRLARWLRAHGGANEADQLSALSLSGDKAQDLYAICQILDIDIELEDIIDTLKDEITPQQKIEEPPLDKETAKNQIIDNPKINEWREILLNNLSFTFNKGCEHNDIYYPDVNLILTNIEKFKDEDGCNFIKNTNIIKIKEDNIPNCILLKSDEISLIYSDINIGKYSKIPRRAFIWGNDVIIRGTNHFCDSICVCAKNIYIDELCKNTILIGENIFIEPRIQEEYSYTNNNLVFICANDILSIGKAFAIPPFTKTKEELLSYDIKTDRNEYNKLNDSNNIYTRLTSKSSSISNYISFEETIRQSIQPKEYSERNNGFYSLWGQHCLFNTNKFNPLVNYSNFSYISAETYLYGCEKEGAALDSSLAHQCYITIKNTLDIWSEINGVFEKRFWNMTDYL